MTHRHRLFALTLLLFSPIVSAAQGTYTQIDVPGALQTEATSINSAGEIVGNYIDSVGGHGFLLRGNTYTTIDYPGVTYSYSQAINDKGQIVGLAEPVGYLFDVPTQTFTSISYPGASYTYPVAINNAGVVAGYYQEPKGKSILTAGFQLAGAQYTSVAPPGAKATYVTAISTTGALVGYAQIGGTIGDFYFYRGQFRQIQIPTNGGPVVYGINPSANTVVGSYDALAGVTGFTYQKNNFQSLSFPGAITTEAFGMNASGIVVGYFLDQNYATHGFVWTPPQK